MSDVICISYTPSREYRDAVNRERRIINDRAFGATAGDSFWMGYGDYDEVDPFARYRDEEESKPITVPAWRERIAKAKRDIQKHSRECECASVVWTDAERSELLSIARQLDEYVIDQRTGQGSVF